MNDADPSGGPGSLLVVGTPIGNLGDLSPRAAEALRTSDLVVAEDTRMAARLLAHIGVRTPTSSLNEHNAAERIPGLVERLRGGQRLALTTDAGMPAVSDPGAALVTAAREAGITVQVVPGPSAVTAAFALAGVAADGFLFRGFLPARPASARAAALRDAVAAGTQAGVPLILFESPHRVRDLLQRLAVARPGARVALGRELTKRHEEMLIGSPAELGESLVEERGEFTLVVYTTHDARDGAKGDAGESGSAVDGPAFVAAARSADLSNRTIVELLVAGGMPRRAAYQLVHEPPSGR